MKYYIFILFIYIMIPGYSQKNKTIDLYEAIAKPEKVILLSDIASDIRYIPLETTSDALIGGGYDISFSEDAIIASSSANTSFYHFDKEGKYKNKIGQKGQGPGEYNLGLFYFLDFNKRHFYTHDWNATYCYTYEGEFVQKIETPNLNMGVAEMLGNDKIIYSNDLYYGKNIEPYQLYIITSTGKPVYKFKGQIEEGKKYGLNLTTRDYMYIFNGDTYFKPALENKVYKISPTTPKKKSLAWDFYTKNKDIDVSRNELNPRNRMKSISIFRLKETHNHLFVLYGLEDKTYVGMYDKSNNNFQNIRIVDDLSGGIDFIPSGKSPDGFLINAYFPKALKENKKYKTGKLPNRVNDLKKLLQEIDEEDNPVLIVVTLK